MDNNFGNISDASISQELLAFNKELMRVFAGEYWITPSLIQSSDGYACSIETRDRILRALSAERNLVTSPSRRQVTRCGTPCSEHDLHDILAKPQIRPSVRPLTKPKSFYREVPQWDIQQERVDEKWGEDGPDNSQLAAANGTSRIYVQSLFARIGTLRSNPILKYNNIPPHGKTR